MAHLLRRGWRQPIYGTGLAKCGPSNQDPVANACEPVPGRNRPYFRYVGTYGLTGAYAPVRQLPGNYEAPGAMSILKIKNAKIAIWNYTVCSTGQPWQTCRARDRSRFSRAGVLTYDGSGGFNIN